MMWWGANGYLAQGWSWPGILIMGLVVVVCAMMMGHRMGGRHHQSPQVHRPDTPQRTLANRLANGEIDIDEYDRLLETLQRSRPGPGHEET